MHSERRAPDRVKERLPALLALALPCLAGLACLALAGAPGAYLAINAGALAAALAWICAGRLPPDEWPRRVLAAVLLAVLALPLVTGPVVNGVARWIRLGPAAINAGLLAIPLLAVLAALDRAYAPPLLLAALLLTLLQPDAAGAFALTFGAVGLHHVTRDWRFGLIAIVAFIAALAASLRGELPARPLADRVLVEFALASPIIALAAFAALVAGFCLMLFAVPMSRSSRYALAGTLFGFSMMGLMSNYPSPLIGHGAAAILGYGLALSDRRSLPG